jgi:hypothetical protein
MKLFSFFIGLLISSMALAQSHNNGTLSAQIGFDAGVHGTVTENRYNNTVVSQDTSAAGTTLANISVSYSITKWLSAGLTFSGGKYIEDPDNAEANGNSIAVYGVSLRLYPANKDKFNWWLGADFGKAGLEINRIYTIFSTPIDNQYVFKGNHMSFNSGINWYFANFMGIHFTMGYSQHKFTLDEYNIEGTAQDLTNTNYTMNTKGAQFKLGLSFKIN